MRPILRLTLLASFLIALPGLTAGADTKAARYYEDALSRYEKKDFDGAIVQLKNALQADRSMLAGHVLMGKLLQAKGDFPASEAAFEEALRLGVNRSEVIIPLGQLYLIQGKYEAVLERVTTNGLTGDVLADALVLRSNAFLERGDKLSAVKALDEARATSDKSIPVRLAQISLAIRGNELPKAAALTDEAIAIAPNDSSLWNARGSLLHLSGDISSAISAYGKAIGLNPKYVDPRLSRAGLYVDLGKWSDVGTEVAELEKIAPDDPRVAYLKAMIAGNRGDSTAVKKSLIDITKALDQAPPAVLYANRQMLFLAALAHYGLHNLEKSSDYLTSYLRSYPNEPGPIKLLASIYLERKDVTRAISLLTPLVRNNPNDARALTLLANAYMLDRNYRQATTLLDQAVKISGGANDIRTDFALSLVGVGSAEKGIQELQQVFARDPKQVRTGLALATLLMRNGQAKIAQDVIDQVVKQEPENLTALNMAGTVRMAAGNPAGARQAFERVISKDPAYHAALLNLVRLDVAEKQFDSARQKLTQLLKSESKNTDGMIEFSNLEAKAGKLTEAVKWLEKARAEPQGALRAGLQLTSFHLRTGSIDQALTVAKETAAKFPEDLTALGSLARTQIAAGEARTARQTLADMTRYAAYNAESQLTIAQLQLTAGNPSGAAYSLDKALATRPDWLPAMIVYCEAMIAQKDYARADQRIKQIAERVPTDPAISRLQGDLSLARGQYAAAIAAYTAGMRKNSGDDLPLRVFQAHLAAGELNKGIAFLDRWQKEHPASPQIARTLADAQLRAGNLAAARTGYEQILKTQPDDADVLNNLAQAVFRLNDNTAIGIAERALSLRPNDAGIIDTLGWILVNHGQIDRGLSHLRDARLRSPDNPEIRFHLAYALNKAGRKLEAREEIGQALRSGATFFGAEDARKLQAEVSK